MNNDIKSTDVKSYYENSEYYSSQIGMNYEELKEKYRVILACEPIQSVDIVLDAGCGKGAIARFSVYWGGAKQAVGFDFSETAIRLANDDLAKFSDEIKQKVTYIIHSISERFPFENNTFSLIYMDDVIEHISEEESEFAFVEISRVCKTGGRLIVFTGPNRLTYTFIDPIYRFLNLFRGRFLPPLKKREYILMQKLHINEQSIWSLKKKFKKHGFKLKTINTQSIPGKIIKPSKLVYKITSRILPRRWFANDILAIGVKQ